METKKEQVREKEQETANKGSGRSKAVKATVFVIIALLMFAYLNTVFTFPTGYDGDFIKERFNCFYEQEDNTMDAVYIGASGVDRYWVAPQAYKDTGITVFNFTSSSLPLVTFKYMVKEALKTQDPRLIILDLRTVYKAPDGITENFIRRVTDNMKLSQNKLDCLDASLDYLRKAENEIDEEDPSWYFSFLKYHSRWKGNMTLQDFTDLNPSTNYMGYAAHHQNIYDMSDTERPVLTDDRIAMDPDTEEVLIDLCEYLQTLDCDVLFVDEPYEVSYKVQGRTNYAIDIVRDYGFDVLSCQDYGVYDDIGLDFSKDFYNKGHTNIVGALKYTEWFGEYLAENYDLPDRRGDDKYKAWDSAYEEYTEKTEAGLADLRKRIANGGAKKYIHPEEEE